MLHKKICLASLLILLMIFSNLQLFSMRKSGDMGLSAGMAMPSGITLSSALPGGVINNILYTYAAGSSFNFFLGDAIQLDLGVGFASVSQIVPTGQTAPDALSAISFSAAAKYFLRSGDVSPYFTAGFSYSGLPTIKNGTIETTGSLITFLGCFGAQAYVNSSKTLALFIQIGFGYNSGKTTTKMGTTSTDGGTTTINLGGSAFGGSIYF